MNLNYSLRYFGAVLASATLGLFSLANAGTETISKGDGKPEVTQRVPGTANPVEPKLPSNADDVLKQLMAGNERFATGQSQNPRRAPKDVAAVAGEQHPVAVVIACADSRVPPELLFDMGVGDLFVIRVAGNVVKGAGVMVTGSIEYAIAELNVPLVIVLGHTDCGAVKSAVKPHGEKDSLPGAIKGMVDLVKPAVAKARREAGDIYGNATRENVRIGVKELEHLEPILAPRVKKGQVKVVGAVYDLSTAKVELLTSDKMTAH